MPLQTDGMVVRNARIKSLYFILGIYCPQIANQIKPGQFIMLKVSENSSPLLRRPFSVYKSYPTHSIEKRKRGCFFILYRKVGKGTQKMTTLKKGQRVNLIGPLGNGFTLPSLPSSANIILIGGGVGIVTLYPLLEVSKAKRIFVLIGGKTKDDILCVQDFRKFVSTVLIATEDGSLGYRGTVVDLFLTQRKKFRKYGKSFIYACGPIEMLKALTRVLRSENFICQASLESRMACGFGACWGCVVKTNHPQSSYQRVCQEGPVFHLEDIRWES
jgi:dihydroorotate dehydrogenase electron transfer subunit